MKRETFGNLTKKRATSAPLRVDRNLGEGRRELFFDDLGRRPGTEACQFKPGSARLFLTGPYRNKIDQGSSAHLRKDIKQHKQNLETSCKIFLPRQKKYLSDHWQAKPTVCQAPVLLHALVWILVVSALTATVQSTDMPLRRVCAACLDTHGILGKCSTRFCIP